jgi:hypothetical protein
MTGLLAEAVFDGLGQVELGLEGVVVQVAVTGSSAAKVRAAALAKLPGGTVDREADTDGSAYGAVTQDHATPATVKLDANHKVASVETAQ